MKFLTIIFILVGVISVGSMHVHSFLRSPKIGCSSEVTKDLIGEVDSALTDGQDVGHDLTGGYYDGQTDYARAAIRWGAEYFLKAHTSTTELYGQVGDGNVDHANWGRPEEMTEERPSAKIDANNPGSDLAGETAAALAAASIVFSSVDSSFSSSCLQAAKELYELADNYRGNYNNAIQGSTSFYASYSYEDELAWGALWLYRATGDSSYKDKASQYVDEYGLLSNDAGWVHNFDWDNKNAGIMALGAEIGGDSKYNSALADYATFIRNNSPRTPQGMLYISQWGPLRHASNVAFILFRAASLGIDVDANRALAQQQVDYALGSTGKSFVVGFGNNPPQRPHHRSSSCPDEPEVCDWNAYNSPDPNPQVLYGAVVGGPDQNDQYTDSRDDYVHNEVACDYNAAFTGAVAAAVELH
ncbi:Endoglucanase 1 [Armadillidium vulgare]|nr:Endoglucanase 1 [Armadillidium vulgare]